MRKTRPKEIARPESAVRTSPQPKETGSRAVTRAQPTYGHPRTAIEGTVSLQRSLGNAAFGQLLTKVGLKVQRQPAVAEELLTEAQIAKAKAFYKARPDLYTPDIIQEIQRKLGVEPTGVIDNETIFAVAAFQAKNPDLKVDGMAGPRTLPIAFPVGQAQKKEQETFAEAARLVVTGWATLKTKEERAEAMGKIANDRLVAAGVPPTANSVKALGGNAGQFKFETWTLELDEADFSKATLTEEEEAEISDTVYHEARHAEQWFMMARMRAGRGFSAAQIATEMGIPSRIATLAKAKPLAKGSMEALIAIGWFDSVYGSGAAKREFILKDAERKFKALEAARKADEKNSTAATQARLEAAEKAHAEAVAKVLDLPEEVDAAHVADKMQEIFEANKP